MWLLVSRDLHLEGSEDILYEDTGLDGTLGQAQLFLGGDHAERSWRMFRNELSGDLSPDKDPVPQRGFLASFKL